jgi:hypothetical protein
LVASGSDSERFVRLVYNLCLEREPDAQGFDHFVGLIERGELRWEGVAEGIMDSAEYRALHGQARTVTPGTAPRLCFVHIEKTAGTSFHEYLLENYAPEEVFPERLWWIEEYLAEEYAKHRLFSGHYGYGLCTGLLPADTRYVTFLRLPTERILSLYYFWRSVKWEFVVGPDREPARLAKTLEFSEFLRNPALQFSLDNAQVRRLLPGRGSADPRMEETHARAAQETLKRLAFAGLKELYGLSTLLFSRTVGMPLPSRYYRRLNAEEIRSHPQHEAVVRQPLNEEQEEVLAEITRWDCELYEASLQAFRERFDAVLGLQIPDAEFVKINMKLPRAARL